MSTSAANESVGLEESPIDLVEDLAALRSWDADRLDEDQIVMAVSGQWATYSLSLAWFDPEEILRLACTFELKAPPERSHELLKTLEHANDRLWLGGFNYWADQDLVAFRYGLALHGDASATSEQVDAVVRGAVDSCERFYPVFHLVAHQSATAEIALGTAWLEAAGQA